MVLRNSPTSLYAKILFDREFSASAVSFALAVDGSVGDVSVSPNEVGGRSTAKDGESLGVLREGCGFLKIWALRFIGKWNN